MKKDKYASVYAHLFQEGKKRPVYAGRIVDGNFQANTKNLPILVDYHLKQVYEAQSKLDLLLSGRLPSEYEFKEKEFEDWKVRLRLSTGVGTPTPQKKQVAAHQTAGYNLYLQLKKSLVRYRTDRLINDISQKTNISTDDVAKVITAVEDFGSK